MCGIAGIYSFEKFKDKQKIKKLATALLLNIEIRGRDATGIALINSDNDEISVYKLDISASDFVRKKQFHKIFRNIEDYNILLLHTRQATHGDTNKSFNNHPHFNKKFNNVLIHNGIISNYEELKKKYKIKLSGDCDSEIILELFNKYNHNFKATLKKLKGNLATALYHKHKLYLYANENPLNICYNKTKNFFLFSSYKNIFKDLFTEEINEEYEVFNFYKNKEEFSIYRFKDEDLLKVFFKSKKIIKEEDISICDDYNISWGRKEIEIKPLKVINENEMTTQFLENDLLKEKEKEILKEIRIKRKDDLINNEYINDYLKEEEYQQQLNEDNAKIHRKPLRNYNAYGYCDGSY